MIQRYGHVLIRHEAAIPLDRWRAILSDFADLIDQKPHRSTNAGNRYGFHPLRIAAESGEWDSLPTLTDDLIAFNGEAGWGKLSADPMVVEREGIAGETLIIRTDRKPYDLFVCSLLLVLNTHAEGAFEIASDGTRKEWDHALAWAGKVLGHVVWPYWL